MGGHYYRERVAKERAGDVFDELTFHESFKFPRPPRVLTPTNVANYVLEAVARFLSPSPKVEGEDNEYRCDDLAAAVRGDLKNAVMRNLKEAYRKEVKDYEKEVKRVHREMMKD